jgi:hypothetical protein
MKFQSAAVLLMIAATGVSAQTAGQAVAARPLPSRQRTAIAATTDVDTQTAQLRAKVAMTQRVQEMETTLNRMHLLLKQMHATAAKNSKDPMAKANLEMWGLMVQQLDKQLEQVKIATRQREDLDARRSALYKQAEEKAAMAARNAQTQSRANVGASVPGNAREPVTTPASQTPAPSSQNQ